MAIWIAQCLCPARHAIMGLAGSADSEQEATTEIAWTLREAVEEALQAGKINPWCGLCHAPDADWRYELGRTPFHTIEEALPVLRQSEAEQAAVRAAFGDLPRSD